MAKTFVKATSQRQSNQSGYVPTHILTDARVRFFLQPILIANVHVRVFATLDANRRCIDEATLAIASTYCMGAMVFAFAIVIVIALARSCARS